MKKISIFALILILTASLTGCWRRKQEPTTMPSTVAPTTQATTPSSSATTEPSIPATSGTVPYASGDTTPATDGLLPDMEGTEGYPGTAPAESTVGENSRSLPRY